MENNRTADELTRINAFSNNTFDLAETEKAIKTKVENSFNYLKGLQKSYMNIHRFNLTEEDLYTTNDGTMCVSVDKDFIDPSNRKDYKNSKFYNNKISLDDINDNPDIFSFVPIIAIDGKSVFSFKVKSSLDGKTEFIFSHVKHIRTYMLGYHTIEITFLNNTTIKQFLTNKYSLEEHGWVLPSTVTGVNLASNINAFIYLRDTDEQCGTNMFEVKTDDNGSIIFDKNNLNIYEFFLYHKSVEVTVISPKYIKEIEGYKKIGRRVDNGRLSSCVIISNDDGKVYAMPIPTNNLFILKRNKITNETTFENNREIVLHYPNIYEIVSDDLSSDEYEYKIYYFYKEMMNTLKYRNDFDYIHRFMIKELNCENFEEVIDKLLYSESTNLKLTDYFLKTFSYEDSDYIYNHGDFFARSKPYDMDYKIDKMNEFVKNDPYTLECYSKNVGVPFESYYLHVENINLENRMRKTTNNETSNPSNYHKFEEPRYVFMFRNENSDSLSLRFYIDGILCTDYYEMHENLIDYIYIPVSNINPTSFIEVEKFNKYRYRETVTFTASDNSAIIEFPKKVNITPTLYDLFMTDENGDILPRDNFKIYAPIDNSYFDISDDTMDDSKISFSLDDGVYEDVETGQLFIDIDEMFNDTSIDSTTGLTIGEIHMTEDFYYQNNRIPFKYLKLSTIRVVCSNGNYLYKPITININKFPYIHHKKIEKPGISRIKLFNGQVKWKNSNSYIRTFIDGRFFPVEYTIKEIEGDTYIIPRCYLNKGETFTVDISPYSYDLECTIDTIPDDFKVSFDGLLSKPFNFAYYDVYLNGRKLTENNVEILSPTIIKLFNVSSKHNLCIYRRDRDNEFFGFPMSAKVPIDEFLNSDEFTDDDKDKLINIILDETRSGSTIIPGNDSEFKISDREEMSTLNYNIYDLYVDVILERVEVMQPNMDSINTENLSKYEALKNEYSYEYTYSGNEYGVIVLSPNKNPYASGILKIGSGL